jgi:predicted DNA-binding transcriptional regulator AlpA
MVKRDPIIPPIRLKPGDRILTQAEAAKLRGVSRETLRKMSEDGLGPRRVQLSRKRFGYRASDFLEI